MILRIILFLLKKQLKVRSEIFMSIVKNYFSWEDLIIGFQARIKRNPNTYEMKFWYYFTNEYISKKTLDIILNADTVKLFIKTLCG